jgi:HlyD family secretion protein
VVTLDNPPDNLRPGLSTTAKVTTARKDNTIAIPIQALVARKPQDLEVTKPGAAPAKMQNTSATAKKDKDQEIEGVFVLTGFGEKKTAEFRPVKTGVYGNADVEVVDGLKEGDQVIIGPFRTLRNLKNQTRVKIEKPDTEKKS